MQVNVTVTDDGGWANGGVNQSAITSFDIVVSGAYLELALATCEAQIDHQSTMCDIAADLEIPCSMIFKGGPGIYRIQMGSIDALVPVAQRAALLHQIGRSPLPRANAQAGSNGGDAATASQGTWSKWMLPGGTWYEGRNCSSAESSRPSCQVEIASIPPGALLFLTVDVLNTDFADTDEFITSVTASGRKLGESFLVSGGSDQECDTHSRILELAQLDASLLASTNSLSVNITASEMVGYYQCAGSTLLAKVILVANCLFVDSFKVTLTPLRLLARTYPPVCLPDDERGVFACLLSCYQVRPRRRACHACASICHHIR